jgi:hypothetical protein
LPWEQTVGALPGQFQPLWVRWSGNGAWSLGSGWATRAAIFRGIPSLAPASALTRRLPKPEVTSVSEPGLSILHLVGTPVQTAAGWRIRVGGALSEATQVVTARTIGGEELLSADRLPLRNTALVVVQAEPVDGPPQPLGDLRAGLVGFGMSTVGLTGADALLIIPPLPDALAARATELIWSRIAARKQAPDGKVLLTLFGDLRTMVAQEEQVEPGAERASLDVLLVLR